MEPSRAPASGGIVTFLVFGAAILLAAVAMVAFGGSFWGWMTAGVLVIVGGIALVVHLARRNRRVA